MIVVLWLIALLGGQSSMPGNSCMVQAYLFNFEPNMHSSNFLTSLETSS